MKQDIDKIRQNNPMHQVASSFGVQLTKNGNEFEACCPFHQESTPSFKIYNKGGVDRFQCFGCGEQGDVIDFVIKIKGLDSKDVVGAAEILGGATRDNVSKMPAIKHGPDPYEGIGILPCPAHPFKPGEWSDLYNPKRSKSGKMKPTMVFEYKDTNGKLTGLVLRNERRDDTGKTTKETPMVQYVKLTDGSKVWARMPFPKPRPLYGLHRIKPDTKQVFIVEGEKAADAGHKSTGACFVSWVGGTFGVRHTDWSAIVGKKVVIWPDFDKVGFETAGVIAEIIKDKCDFRLLMKR